MKNSRWYEVDSLNLQKILNLFLAYFISLCLNWGSLWVATLMLTSVYDHKVVKCFSLWAPNSNITSVTWQLRSANSQAPLKTSEIRNSRGGDQWLLSWVWGGCHTDWETVNLAVTSPAPKYILSSYKTPFSFLTHVVCSITMGQNTKLSKI